MPQEAQKPKQSRNLPNHKLRFRFWKAFFRFGIYIIIVPTHSIYPISGILPFWKILSVIKKEIQIFQSIIHLMQDTVLLIENLSTVWTNRDLPHFSFQSIFLCQYLSCRLLESGKTQNHTHDMQNSMDMSSQSFLRTSTFCRYCS